MLTLLLVALAQHHGGFKPIGGIEGENPGYDKSRAPAKVIAALGLKGGERVADVGAGRGYLTLRLAEAVGPKGRVTATDVDEDAIATLRASTKDKKTIEVRQTKADDPLLEPETYDLILLSEVDHFLPDRLGFLKKLASALKPNGRLAVTHVRAMRPPLEADAKQAGFVLLTDFGELPDHYLLIFQRPQRSGLR